MKEKMEHRTKWIICKVDFNCFFFFNSERFGRGTKDFFIECLVNEIIENYFRLIFLYILVFFSFLFCFFLFLVG